MTASTHAPTTIAEASISRDAATALIAAAHVGAEQAGFAAAVAVTDLGGHLRAFDRADQAPFLVGDVAIGKAWTAVSYRLATYVWNDYVTDPKVAPLQHIDELVAVGGGYPIIIDGNVVGGLGISGGTHEQDRRAPRGRPRGARLRTAGRRVIAIPARAFRPGGRGVRRAPRLGFWAVAFAFVMVMSSSAAAPTPLYVLYAARESDAREGATTMPEGRAVNEDLAELQRLTYASFPVAPGAARGVSAGPRPGPAPPSVPSRQGFER